MIDIDGRFWIPDSELSISYTGSSGPGGQHVNKASTKAVLRWDLGNSETIPDGVKERFRERFGTRVTSEDQVIVTSDRSRSASQNLADCEEKLRDMIVSVLQAPESRKATAPSRSAIRRAKERQKRHSQKKKERRWKPEDE